MRPTIRLLSHFLQFRPSFPLSNHVIRFVLYYPKLDSLLKHRSLPISLGSVLNFCLGCLKRLSHLQTLDSVVLTEVHKTEFFWFIYLSRKGFCPLWRPLHLNIPVFLQVKTYISNSKENLYFIFVTHPSTYVSRSYVFNEIPIFRPLIVVYLP